MTKPKQDKRPEAGANPHLIAHAALARLVLNDPKFVSFRDRIIPELGPWVMDDLLLTFRFMRDVPRKGSPMAKWFAQIRKAGRRYRYDEMEEGDWAFFQMVVTGGPPDLSWVGAGPSYEWILTLHISSGERFDSVMNRVRRSVEAKWPEIEERWTDRRWAENIPGEDIEQFVDWFFKVTVQRQRQDLVAHHSHTSDRTVRRGLRKLRRLFGLAARKGPPPK